MLTSERQIRLLIREILAEYVVPMSYSLKQWKKKTGCPMLLNTSLNIKGEPIVNDKMDAKRFETKYNVRVV